VLMVDGARSGLRHDSSIALLVEDVARRRRQYCHTSTRTGVPPEWPFSASVLLQPLILTVFGELTQAENATPGTAASVLDRPRETTSPSLEPGAATVAVLQA
jgi:hypothetical protein